MDESIGNVLIEDNYERVMKFDPRSYYGVVELFA